MMVGFMWVVLNRDVIIEVVVVFLCVFVIVIYYFNCMSLVSILVFLSIGSRCFCVLINFVLLCLIVVEMIIVDVLFKLLDCWLIWMGIFKLSKCWMLGFKEILLFWIV